MYIKYSENAYQGVNNLREIVNCTGEPLIGTNCVQVTSIMITTNFDEKNLMLYNISTNQIIEKSLDQLKLEKLLIYQGMLLNRLMPATMAIAAQDAANKIKVEKAKAPVETIEGDDVEIIGDYLNTVATFHVTWTPANYNLEDIDENIFNGGVTLPDVISRYLQ